MTTIPTITASELQAKRDAGAHVQLIDVRTPLEFREVHVDFARNVPLDRLDPEKLMQGRNGSAGEPLYVNTDILLGGYGGECYRNYVFAPWDGHHEKMWQVVTDTVQDDVIYRTDDDGETFVEVYRDPDVLIDRVRVAPSDERFIYASGALGFTEGELRHSFMIVSEDGGTKVMAGISGTDLGNTGELQNAITEIVGGTKRIGTRRLAGGKEKGPSRLVMYGVAAPVTLAFILFGYVVFFSGSDTPKVQPDVAANPHTPAPAPTRIPSPTRAPRTTSARC